MEWNIFMSENDVQPEVTKKQYIIGIDEAGRGCVVGPLILAGVLIESKQVHDLMKLGIRDSKKYTTVEKRIEAAMELEVLLPTTQIVTRLAMAREIDISSSYRTLDDIERTLAESIIRDLFKVVPLDGQILSVVLDGKQMFKPLVTKLSKEFKDTKFESLDKADTTEVQVAAASVVAKVHRNIHTRNIMTEEYFSNGAGYPNPGTEEWIRDTWEQEVTHRNIRKSWSWYKDLLKKLEGEGYAEPKFDL